MNDYLLVNKPMIFHYIKENMNSSKRMHHKIIAGKKTIEKNKKKLVIVSIYILKNENLLQFRIENSLSCG